MSRFYVVILSILIGAQSLLADVLVNAEDTRFEGVVTAFDRLGKATLATGYGDLTFDVKTEVKDAAMTTYNWPKAKAPAPSRSAEFEKWAKELAAAKAKMQTWQEMPKDKEAGEVDFASIESKGSAYLKMQAEGVSVKDRREERRKINESTEYAYIAVRVERVQNQGGNHFVACERELRDPRTSTKLSTESHFQAGGLWSEKGVKAEDVDKRNTEWAKAITDGDQNPYRETNRWIDYSRAEELEGGDLVVMRLSLFVGDDEQVRYLAVPVRYKTMKVAKEK